MSFAPVYNAHSRALILGTWPSPKSREMAFYYGHPQNRFWPMLAALTGEAVPAREDIEAKKQIILRHGLALWDTLERCTITGASDASIRDVVPNDIAGLLAKAPIEAVFCNGATAYKIYTRYLEPISGIPAVKLPSTSPANAACRPDLPGLPRARPMRKDSPRPGRDVASATEWGIWHRGAMTERASHEILISKL